MQTILPAPRLLLFALATMSLVVSMGCGLKGDLFLPEQPDPPGQTGQSSPPMDPEADAAEDREDESADRGSPSRS